jgi:hypothetical protein
MIVDHDKAKGRKTSEAIRKIAEAVPLVAQRRRQAGSAAGPA